MVRRMVEDIKADMVSFGRNPSRIRRGFRTGFPMVGFRSQATRTFCEPRVACVLHGAIGNAW